MTTLPDDIVKVADGSLAEVEAWGVALRAAGIECRVVGDHLTAGFGSAIPGSAELWVHHLHAAIARDILAGHDASPANHGHPVSDPKPDPTKELPHGGPHHSRRPRGH
jgi:hypothetical protein